MRIEQIAMYVKNFEKAKIFFETLGNCETQI